RRVARFDQQFSGARSLAPDEVANLAELAREAGEDEVAERWSAWLNENAPSHPSVLSQRAFEAYVSRETDLRGAFQTMETLWASIPGAPDVRHRGVANLGLRLGLWAEDVEKSVRWADRRSQIAPFERSRIAGALMAFAGTRAEGIRRIEQLATHIADAPAGERGLFRTADEHLKRRDRTAAILRAGAADAHLALGDSAKALSVLNGAYEYLWSPRYHEDLAALRLAAADTTGGVEALARLSLSLPNADSVASVAVGLVGEPEWAEARGQAESDLLDRALAEAISRRLPDQIEVSDPSGEPVDLAGRLRDGRSAVVVFVSRYCGGSISDAPNISALAKRLRASNVEVLALTDELPSQEAVSDLRDQGLDVPVFFDGDRSAQRAFVNAGTPIFFIVDGNGIVRFEHIRSLSEVARNVSALVQRSEGGG
ncbi:MAG: TlpA disulfide reductase family protein, partial [Bacteroidota bacterium]